MLVAADVLHNALCRVHDCIFRVSMSDWRVDLNGLLGNLKN